MKEIVRGLEFANHDELLKLLRQALKVVVRKIKRLEANEVLGRWTRAGDPGGCVPEKVVSSWSCRTVAKKCDCFQRWTD